MAPAAVKNGNGWAKRLLIWLAGVGAPLFVVFLIWLGLSVRDIQGSVVRLEKAVLDINSATARKATEERNRALAQIATLEAREQLRIEQSRRPAPQ